MLEAHAESLTSFKTVRLPPLFAYTASLYIGCWIGSSEFLGILWGSDQMNLVIDPALKPSLGEELMTSIASFDFAQSIELLNTIVSFLFSLPDLTIYSIALLLSLVGLSFLALQARVERREKNYLKQAISKILGLVLIAIFGFTYASISVSLWRGTCIQVQNVLSQEDKAQEYEFLGQLVEDARVFDTEKILVVQLESLSNKQLEKILKNKILSLSCNNDGEDYLQGRRISGKVKLKALNDLHDSSRHNQNKYSNIVAQGRVASLQQEESLAPLSFLQDIRYRALDLFKTQEGDNNKEPLLLARALLFGERSELFSSQLTQNMRILGLSHVIAVSGAHLILVVGMCSILIKRIAPYKYIQIFILIAVIGFYLVLTGFPLSALRAAGLSILALGSYFGKRRSFPLQALSLTVFLFMLINPASSLSLSLQLSVLACLGILLFSKRITHFFELKCPTLPNFIQESLALSLSSLVTTLPLTLMLFNTLPLLVLPANILASIFMTVICPLGLVLSILGLSLPFLWNALLQPLLLLLKIFLGCVEELAALPFAAIDIHPEPIHLLLLALALLIAMRQKKETRCKENYLAALSACLLTFLCCAVLTQLISYDELIMLNVGQGDALLFKSKHKSFLIDTGAHESLLLKELQKFNTPSITTLALTHPDADHVGALAVFNNQIDLKEVLLSAPSKNSKSEKVAALKSNIEGLPSVTLKYAAQGDVVTCGNFSYKVLGPREFKYDGANEDSLCLVASLPFKSNKHKDNEWRILLTGDAESEIFDTLLQEQHIAPVDIYKLAHHGAKHSMSNLLVEQLRPRLGLISCGKNNRYGHPKEESLKMLKTYDISYCRTDLQESIRIIFRDDKAFVLRC